MTIPRTSITVRVIARGGKFLAADAGGVLVTIRDARTGVLLASGPTAGGSGNTAAIMSEARKRGVPIPTEQDASAFTASLALDEPTLLDVSAFGPGGGLQSAHRSSVHREHARQAPGADWPAFYARFFAERYGSGAGSRSS